MSALCTAFISFSFFLLGIQASTRPPYASSQRNHTLAPLHGTNNPTVIPGEYIVHFSEGHDLATHEHAVGINATQLDHFQWKSWLPGYRLRTEDDDLLTRIRADPKVELVECNLEVSIPTPVNVTRPGPPSLRPRRRPRFVEAINSRAQYNLAMVGAKGKLSIPSTSDTDEYDWVTGLGGSGTGVQVFIVDTGIMLDHVLFEGRAINFGGLSPDEKSPYVDEIMDDLVGHGTHVAGIAGAAEYGVAPGVTLVNVKFINRYLRGQTERLAEVISDITAVHLRNKANYPDGFQFRGSVINMSLGWYTDLKGSPLIEKAFKKAYKAGIHLVAASGNEYTTYPIDKLQPWPCASKFVVCVGASRRSD